VVVVLQGKAAVVVLQEKAVLAEAALAEVVWVEGAQSYCIRLLEWA